MDKSNTYLLLLFSISLFSKHSVTA